MLQEPRLISCTAAFCPVVLSGGHHEEFATFPDSKNLILVINIINKNTYTVSLSSSSCELIWLCGYGLQVFRGQYVTIEMQ